MHVESLHRSAHGSCLEAAQAPDGAAAAGTNAAEQMLTVVAERWPARLSPRHSLQRACGGWIAAVERARREISYDLTLQNGSEVIGVADLPYKPDPCKELGFLDYSKETKK